MQLDLVRLIILQTVIKLNYGFLITHEITRDVNRIKFFLYTNDTGVREEIKLYDKRSLKKSSYKRYAPTVFLIHGFATNWPTSMMEYYMKSSPLINANHIMVDWSHLAGRVINPLHLAPLYLIAMDNVAPTGKKVAKFIRWLHKLGYIDLDFVHLIGISMGAHAAGRAGEQIQLTMGGKKISRITGLDPAGPLYHPAIKGVNLGKDDANFVDIYHSSRGFYGESDSSGHVDFILNDGNRQPGCNFITNLLTCSHNYAIFLFFDSMKHQYVGCQCLKGRVEETTNFKRCMRTCPNPVVAGLYTPHSTRGEYTVLGGNLLPSMTDIFNYWILG